MLSASVPTFSSLQVPLHVLLLPHQIRHSLSLEILPPATGHVYMLFPLPRMFFSHQTSDGSSFFSQLINHFLWEAFPDNLLLHTGLSVLSGLCCDKS